MYHFLVNLVRFSRLHTIIGTSLSVICLYYMAFQLAGLEVHRLDLCLLVLASCLGANIYIVGLNQLTDVEIDKINKPYLPLASGAYTRKMAKVIIGVAVLVSLALAFSQNYFLIITVVLSLLLGTIYSLPPIRLKRFPFWAAFCIIAVRGIIVNLFLFLTFYFAFTQSVQIPPIIWILTITFFIFGTIIAWFKDLPDVEGDAAFAIRTLSISWGKGKVFRLGKRIMYGMFAGLALIPWILDLPVRGLVFSVSQVAILFYFWRRSQELDLEDNASIKGYYQFVWILFFLEYIVFALCMKSV